MHAGFWPTYNKVSREFDEKRLGKWDRDLDILLVFVSLVVMGDRLSLILTGLAHDLQAALWSGVVTSFLIRTFDDLGPDYQQQTVLLLYQLVNGGGPNIPDPTIPTTPAGLAIAVNSLLCMSLTVSVCATVYAMSLKWWLTEYGYDMGPVGGLRRACRRHTQFKTFEQLYAHIFIAVLPGLLLFSIMLFTLGGALFFWQLDKIVLAIYSLVAGFFLVAYLLVFTLPSAAGLPLFDYSTFISYRPSFIIGKAAIFIVNGFLHICCSTLRYLIGSMFFPIIQIVCGTGTLHHWYKRTKKTSSEGRGFTLVQLATAPRYDSDDFDISQEAQAEAILWLTRVPLDPPESRALVSSLALISSSHPYGRFQRSVVELATLVLEAWFREEGRDQTDTVIDCILVLGNAKFQAAVDKNLDCDRDIGGIPVPPFVAWVAQWFTIDAFQTKSDPSYSEETQAMLLTATAWLSPAGGTKDAEEAKDTEWNGLKIQDRREFIKEIKAMLERHVRSDNPVNNEVLIDLIHGMHACIPRGDPNNASSIVPFLSIFYENYDSPWSEDEAVVRALITYALDLLSSSPERKLLVDRKTTHALDPLSSPKRKPLVDREITFDDLASELIDVLMVNTTHPDVVTFTFWLACRVPHEFKSRETVLADIAYIWGQTNEGIPEDHRERLNLYATDAFTVVAQHYAMANDGLSGLTDHTALKFLSAAIESRHNLSMTIYTMAMILNLGTSTQATPVTNEIKRESITDALFTGLGDPEKGAADEDVVDTRIYSTLILLKLPRTPDEPDVGKIQVLIVQMEKVIGNPSVGDSGVTKEVAQSSEAGVDVDLDRARWKAIYLLALLLKFIPDDKRGEHVEGLWTRVRTLLEGGELSFMGDYGLCLEPLGRDVSELGTPPADQQSQKSAVFEEWISGFPLLPLAGAERESSPGQRRNHPSFFNPKRWFR